MKHQKIDIVFLQALLAIAVSGITLVGVAMARTEVKQVSFRIAPPPQFELRINDAGDAFEFSGLVDFGLTEALRKLVTEHPNVKRVILDSRGGYIAEARGAVTVLRAEEIATHVSGQCESACALIFVGGNERTLGPEGRLGLHGYALQRERQFGMIDPVAEMQRDLVIYRASGLDEAFVAKLADLPQNPMWYPTRAELRTAGFLTHP